MSTGVSADRVAGLVPPAAQPPPGRDVDPPDETGQIRHQGCAQPRGSTRTDSQWQECPEPLDPARDQRRPPRRWRRLALDLAAIAGAFGLIVAVIGGLAIGAAQRASSSPGESYPVAADGPGAIAARPTGPTPTATATATAAAPSQRVDPAWARRVASATGIPIRALRAYASAALQVRTEQPRCGLGWNTVAAIGAIESGHGTHDGARLLASGRSEPAIRGPVLDGSAGAAIRDTDHGRLDGIATWDRAVGPLQFIPSTWRRWGADGNGDGTADPDQVDDAALTAARYLCASGSVAAPSAWRAAVFSYNHSAAYVDRVAALANQYAAVAG